MQSNKEKRRHVRPRAEIVNIRIKIRYKPIKKSELPLTCQNLQHKTKNVTGLNAYPTYFYESAKDSHETP